MSDKIKGIYDDFANGITNSDKLKEYQPPLKEKYILEKGHYENKAQDLGKLVDEKQKAYGNSVSVSEEVLRAFLKPYKRYSATTGYTYEIPEELLAHILLQIRIIDKQCRIFSNPKKDRMDESPYRDIAGYGLLGMA